MNNKQLLKRIFTISSFLVMAVLLLTACNGAFSFGGSVNPNDEGGVDVSGGAQPASPTQPAEGTGLSQTTIILIVVGVALFILVLVLALTRGQSKSEPPA